MLIPAGAVHEVWFEGVRTLSLYVEPVAVTYETGPTGFVLYRGEVPRRPGQPASARPDRPGPSDLLREPVHHGWGGSAWNDPWNTYEQPNRTAARPRSPHPGTPTKYKTPSPMEQGWSSHPPT
ncbi:hypothetical protein AUCHE_08_04500 [Austwickia chelonae NBRC 105200]|uniref:Uncharacterized protein n=1 Tax=Austwickia chelonae NBRC 105200 TaxID=1184607 RepID=K6VS90_9MICO|nr:hypothetical protein AUCHE_08_04500 [Austwickia chelonae NBRC 105200]